ncbi:MAG: SHOCT domain-containing protein [Dehalococcoidia bacterium]|nr:MAG: SHOCT domain-containing protein [Dehalococcoidia bacterium]
MMWDWPSWGWGMWGMGLGAFFMILFWGAVIGLIVWLIVRLTRGEDKDRIEKHKPVDPIDIAKERYAKGEISKGEFEQIKKTLS